MRDKVTISLFSIEIDNFPGYRRGFLDELANIKKICDGLTKAAIATGRASPEFVVSILLIPDWTKKNNSYSNNGYLDKKYAFLKEARDKFEAIEGVKIQDFFSECVMTDQERFYMHNLRVLGSNADMIKTRAIINNADRCRHLQMDSNTIIPSFRNLYACTFLPAEQKDGLNASFYDDYYVSAHNKMVYTTPGGEIDKRSNLEIHLWEWCHNNQNNNSDKEKEKNSIYSKVFTAALHEIIYTKKYTFDDGKKIYPATLNPNIYWLTNCMVTALNMSWSTSDKPGIYRGIENLKNLPSVSIGEDGAFNFQCFFNVIKKHTGDLSMHSHMLDIPDTTSMGEESRKLLLANSNEGLELEAVKRFYDNTRGNRPEQLEELSLVIPPTAEGNKLTQLLFGCDVLKLQEDANRITNSLSGVIDAEVADTLDEKHTDKVENKIGSLGMRKS